MRVLLTGAEGFVGRPVRRALESRGHEVLSTTLTGNGEGLVPLDVADRRATAEVVARLRPEAVIHLAALSDVAASWKDLAGTFQVNVLGTESVLDAVGPEVPFVLASSAEVYGSVPRAELPAREDRALAPATPYALTKAAAERLVLRRGGVAVRSYNLVGRGQSDRFALPSFARQLAAMAAGGMEPILRVGNLETYRDFVHVDDGAEAYVTLLERGEPGTAYNLSSGRGVKMRDALDRLVAQSGLDVAIEIDPQRFRPADVPWSWGDPSRLEALGWSRRRSLDDALGELWSAMLEEVR